MDKQVYKILTPQQWARFQQQEVFSGTELDRKDGYIHCSGAGQVRNTLEKHFNNQKGLIILSLNVEALRHLRWEAAASGEIFPHVYANIALAAVTGVIPQEQWPSR